MANQISTAVVLAGGAGIRLMPLTDRISARLLGDERLRNRLTKNALAWSREFSWDNTAREFMRIMESNI